MRSGLGFLPLAVLGKPAPGQTRRQWVPVVLEQVARRVVREAPADRADVLIAAAVILGGMYLPPDDMRKAIHTEYQGFLTMSRSFGSWEGIRCSDSR